MAGLPQERTRDRWEREARAWTRCLDRYIKELQLQEKAQGVHTVGKSGTYVRPLPDPNSRHFGNGDTIAEKCQHEFVLRPLIPAPDLLSQPEYWSLPKNVDRVCPQCWSQLAGQWWESVGHCWKCDLRVCIFCGDRSKFKGSILGQWKARRPDGFR